VFIEDGVTLWGQVGVRSDITIGAGAVVLAQTGISKGLEGGKTYFGSPVGESREKLKELANTRKIPGLIEEIKQLKQQLNE
jgi:UDP-3-O-[3-hydroxymyristoyl] glucosamine N-acyltransferase